MRFTENISSKFVSLDKNMWSIKVSERIRACVYISETVWRENHNIRIVNKFKMSQNLNNQY